MTNCAKVAAALHRHLCEHDWHGYTQGSGRWGDGEGVCRVTVDGKTYELQQGDRDCSSSVIECWQTALKGTAYEGALDAATYTGNMRQVFVGSGLFEWMPMTFIAQPGDIYLNERDHTAMCQSAIPDVMSEFVIAEDGTIIGKQVGDQTGHESHIREYSDFPWDGILHYNGLADTAQEGWQKSGTRWWYREADGSFPVLRWRKINGHWYRFDKDGYCKTGWYLEDGFWYYLMPVASGDTPECAAAKGWHKIDGAWYYFNKTRDGDWPECSMVADCKVIDGKKYHFASSGRWIEE